MHQRIQVPFARIYIPLSTKKNETLVGLKVRIFLDAEHLHHLYTFSTRCMHGGKGGGGGGALFPPQEIMLL